MSGSLNKVMLIGNLGADPEVKSFASGGKICNLRIATSETWTDRQSGERRERTEWHSVVIRSEGLVGVAERYARKGGKLYIEGQLQTRKWQDQAGNDRYSTEIVVGPRGVMTLLDRPPGQGGGGGGSSGGAGSGQSGSAGSGQSASTGSGQAFNDGFDDDEIPF